MDHEQARTAIAAAVAQIAPEADLAAVDPGGDLREQLDLDSMDFLNLVVRLTETTGVTIDEDHYPRLGTLAGAVEHLVAGSGAPSTA